ncbi:MAG: hypothetical protein QOE70_4137 [Chthoniobacter sp.]|jgi:hypothetical protein|nr:hypothetical protein [Chthoniobacter sp.]
MKQLCLLALFVALGLAAHTAESQPPVLRAGVAATDITPTEFPLNMPGGFSPNPATSAHDPLYARALALARGAAESELRGKLRVRRQGPNGPCDKA